MKFELHLAKVKSGNLDWDYRASVEAADLYAAAAKLGMSIIQSAGKVAAFLNVTPKQKNDGYVKAILLVPPEGAAPLPDPVVQEV